eukprot:369711-Amphidinium_carterae.1
MSKAEAENAEEVPCGATTPTFICQYWLCPFPFTSHGWHRELTFLERVLQPPQSRDLAHRASSDSCTESCFVKLVLANPIEA